MTLAEGQFAKEFADSLFAGDEARRALQALPGAPPRVVGLFVRTRYVDKTCDAK